MFIPLMNKLFITVNPENSDNQLPEHIFNRINTFFVIKSTLRTGAGTKNEKDIRNINIL